MNVCPRPVARWLRWVAIGLFVVVAAGYLYAAVHKRGDSCDGDFDLHRRFGERLLTGSPPLYADYLCFNYMPISALYHLPLALVPTKAAFIARYCVAVLCLVLILGLLWRMLPAGEARSPALWVAGLTLLLAAGHVSRDLDSAGLHLTLLAMLVGGAYCAWRGRELAGGSLFGLAIALKMSPALLLPYLAWKRRWRLLAVTVAATALWIILPALWMGPGTWWHYQQEWNAIGLGTFTGKVPEYIKEFVDLNDLRVGNQSLRLALLHPLVTYPEGHALHPEIGYWSLLDLNPAVARLLLNLSLAAVLAAFWWPTRRASRGPGDPTWPLEMAGLLVLMLLLSPVTWTQHLVWTIPALYFVVAADQSSRRPRLARAGLVLIALLTLLQHRHIGGVVLSNVLFASHVHTFNLVLLLCLVMARRQAVEAAPASVAADTVFVPAIPASGCATPNGKQPRAA